MDNKFKGNRRYGWDTLSIVIGVIGAVFWAFVPYGSFMGIPLIIYAFWRSRSMDFLNRKREEKIFHDFLGKCIQVLSKFNDNALFYEVKKCFIEWSQKSQVKSKHSNITCPRCKTIIKIQKKKGVNMVSCPKCLTRLRTKN